MFGWHTYHTAAMAGQAATHVTHSSRICTHTKVHTIAASCTALQAPCSNNSFRLHPNPDQTNTTAAWPHTPLGSTNWYTASTLQLVGQCITTVVHRGQVNYRAQTASSHQPGHADSHTATRLLACNACQHQPHTTRGCVQSNRTIALHCSQPPRCPHSCHPPFQGCIRTLLLPFTRPLNKPQGSLQCE